MNDEPVLLIDESLSPNVAKALGLVGYKMLTVSEVDDFRGMDRVSDQTLIPWLGVHDIVWVHADDNAKREHRKLIIANRIRTLWVYRPKGKMSSRDQLTVLCHVLPEFLENLRSKPQKKHYAALIQGQRARPRLKEMTI